jgi:NAD(P)-dependent dehydrogenase (short-subunit alcohol dehydrogenase family)
MTQDVALILGYGPIVGTSAARAFAAKGYKIAIVSRTRKDSDSEKDYLQIQADLSDPSSVESTFSKVITELGHPSVVLYNGASLHFHARYVQ